MKRRPRVKAKPVIPLQEGVAKPVGDVVVCDSASTSVSGSLADGATNIQVSNSASKVSRPVVTEERDILEVAAKNDTSNIGVLTQDTDESALKSFTVHKFVTQEKNKEEKIFGNLNITDRLASGSVGSTDQSLSEPNLNEISGCHAESVSVPTILPKIVHTVKMPEIEIHADCHGDGQDLDVVKEPSLLSEKSACGQLTEECKESAEVESKDSGPQQKRRRFIRKVPNVVKNMQSSTSYKVNASDANTESSAEVELSLPPPQAESVATFGDVNSGNSSMNSVGTDAANGCKALSKSAELVDGLEIGPNIDTVDLCKPPSSLPVLPQVVSPKGRHHFTKVRPNLANSLASKQNTASDRLPDVSASTVDDCPFIPPAMTALPNTTHRLEEGIAMEESVVVLPETVEKAAAKLIARKLRQKKKKRALESLDAPIDSSKVCMRDLIYMNPVNNPMRKPKPVESVSNGSSKSSIAARKPPTSAPVVSTAPVTQNVVAPQLKIGPDGSIIINEASLVIERQPLPNFDGMDAIEETDVKCGYPKRSRTRSWTKKETRKFFAALSMIGTDFFLMMNLFPGRTRAELKRKFKREEKIHQAMVETALNDRRSLDMSLMAIQSSDEEEVKPKCRQPGKRGPRATKKQPLEGSADKGKMLGGKENDPQPVPPVKMEKKRKREKEKQPGKKQKKKKSRYYEESSDEADEEIEEQFESGDAESAAEEEDDHRTIAKVPSLHSSDEDEVEIVSCISKRPTRSGRVPKPVKTYNPVKFSDLEASAVGDSVPPIKTLPLPARRKVESFTLPSQTTILSPTRSSGLMSPPHAPFMSPSRNLCASPRVTCSPMPLFGSPSPFGSPTHASVLSPLVSCSPSSQVSLLAASIPGLENVPPGKQLMIVASPMMPGETGEPPQQLLHVFMVSSPAVSSDNCSNGQQPVPVESMPGGNCPRVTADSGLVARSLGNSTRERFFRDDDGFVSTTAQVENSSSSVVSHSVANCKNLNLSQVTLDLCSFNPSMLSTPEPTQLNIDSQKSESFATDSSLVSLGSKFEETLASTLFAGRHPNDTTDLDRTHGTNGCVSPILSTSAVEYCISQVTNMASLQFSEAAADDDHIYEEDIDLEGNITDVVQQDDGTLVIIAESANVISPNCVPETLLSTDQEPDLKSQSTESVEISLKKDSDNKQHSIEQIPLDRGEREGQTSEAIDVKFEFVGGRNGSDKTDEFIEVFIEPLQDLGPMLDIGTLSVTETMRDVEFMSYAADDKSKPVAKEEILEAAVVKCRKELMLKEKCVLGDVQSVHASDISAELNKRDSTRLGCTSVLPLIAKESTDELPLIAEESTDELPLIAEESTDELPLVAKESTDELPLIAKESTDELPLIAKESTGVNINLEPLSTAAIEFTKVGGGSELLNSNTNRSRFLNVMPLPDGSIELVLDNGAWSTEDPDQERYVDIEFPLFDEDN